MENEDRYPVTLWFAFPVDTRQKPHSTDVEQLHKVTYLMTDDEITLFASAMFDEECRQITMKTMRRTSWPLGVDTLVTLNTDKVCMVEWPIKKFDLIEEAMKDICDIEP